MSSLPHNFYCHSPHLYTVVNQNGLNNALYHYMDVGRNKWGSTKEEVRKMLQNYPKHYPSTFIIIDQSFECARLYIEEIDINEMAHSWPSPIYLLRPIGNKLI